MENKYEEEKKYLGEELWRFFNDNIPDFLQKKVVAKNLKGYGNSLVATDHIKKNEIILKIPEKIFISMKDVGENKVIQKIIENSPKQI